MRVRSRARSFIKTATLQGWGPRSSSLFFAVLALLLFALSIASPGNLGVVRTSAADVFAPALAIVNYPVEKAAAYVSAVTGLASLQEQNRKLLEENERLRVWYHTAMQLKTDNEALQRLLNVKLEPQHTFVSARIVADSDTAFARSVLVLAGKTQGVTSAQAVLAGEGLVGRTVESGVRTSRVLLITDMNARVPVLVGDSGIQAMLAGNNGSIPDLVHLPPDTKFKGGEKIMTSGHGGVYPYGLPVGEVVLRSDGSAGVKLYADMDRTTYVRIVSRNDDPGLVLAPAPEEMQER